MMGAIRYGRAALGLALAGLLLSSCGGGGGGSGSLASDKLAQICALPRSGIDPATGQPYPDRQGSLSDEQRWLNAYLHEIYLWYREIPTVNAAGFTVAAYGSVLDAMDAYFQALKTPAVTASGRPKDRFHFLYPTAQWQAESEAGVAIGYGMQVALLSPAPPREAVIVYTDAQTPAASAGIARGAHILAIDGVDLRNDATQSGVDTLNAGLFPSAAGEQHLFRIQDEGSGTTRDVMLMAQEIVETPVPLVKTVDTAGGKVGYLLFNDHIATAEGELYDAVQQLSAAGIADLVLDLRYNGGGYLDIASELAYMIAGKAASQGRIFEKATFNDRNPLADSPDASTPFHDTAQGFDPTLADGTALPQLKLQRLFVLAGPGTCSASEALINGLRGIDIPVALIGGTTCGKPYGFYPQDNCGITYFAIQFAGTNDRGFGDYADGFAPDCAVDDDFAHALGDTSEAMLAAALSYRDSGSCTATAKRAGHPPTLLRAPVREIRWQRRGS